MRFTRGDIPGFAIALLAGPAMMVLFLASFEVWDHQGTPLLGAMAANLAIGAGLLAVFSRFIRNWDIPLSLLGILVVIVISVNVMQRTGDDGTGWATALKLIGVLDFLLLNLAVVGQMLWHGLIPVMDRRAARAADAGDA
ncbi:MAG TPA: hypothetical protein QGI71_02465 [Dehalococcoidia bacterium]|nr:hypothetical protein [Dehalococcoidia bacterium]